MNSSSNLPMKNLLLFCLLVSLLSVKAGTITYDEYTQKPIEIRYDANNYILYVYDGQDRRIMKIRHLTDAENNEYRDTAFYTYGTHGLPLKEEIRGTFKAEGSNTAVSLHRIKNHFYGHEYGSIAMEEQGKDASLDYFIRDHQSSLRVALKGSDNSPTAIISYDAYGKKISETNGTLSVAGPYHKKYTHTYTGQEADVETGLYNFRARLYDANQKIFLQPDPKHQYYSPYVFVGNDPVNNVDNTGMISVRSKDIPNFVNAHLAEEHAKKVFPHGAANQNYSIIRSGGEAAARGMYNNYLKRITDRNRFTDLQNRIARSCVSGGGVCDDFAAVTFGELSTMRSQNIINKPIHMVIFPEAKHSLNVIGDVNSSNAIVVDPWVEDPYPHYAKHDHFFDGESPSIINSL